MTTFTVNGRPLDFRMDPQTPLLWVLRDVAHVCIGIAETLSGHEGAHLAVKFGEWHPTGTWRAAGRVAPKLQ